MVSDESVRIFIIKNKGRNPNELNLSELLEVAISYFNLKSTIQRNGYRTSFIIVSEQEYKLIKRIIYWSDTSSTLETAFDEVIYAYLS